MRVLMIVEAGGGVARHVVDLCSGLCANGVDVHLIYSPNRMDPVLAEGLSALSLLPVKIYPVPMARKPAFSDCCALWKIRKYAIKMGPFDIVHGHSSKGGGLARLLFCAGIQAKCYSAHAFITMNPGLSWLESTVYAFAEWFLALLGDAVIVTSNAEQQHAESFLGIASKKLLLIPNGIDLPLSETQNLRDDLRHDWGVSDSDILVGTVVRFVEQKAPIVLIEAFAKVTQRFENVRLVMVGDGPMQPQLKKVAEKLNIAHFVTWPGYVKEKKLMEAFDIFTLSSDYEGFPYVFLDALCAGLPLVTTQVGGSDMVVDEGENGYIVPCRDVKAMSEALSVLVTDAKLRNRMGAASLLKAKSFSVTEMTKKTLDLYTSLLPPHILGKT
jgi:glycosyltransferase involved in cell wall biosynthesis